MTTKWDKYTYVCGNCDSLIEITTTHKDLETWCVCAESQLTLLSVDDATIYPTTTKEEQMETAPSNTYSPNQLVTYKKIENGEVSYPTDKVVDIEYALDQGRRNYKTLTEKQNEWYRKESQLRTLLEEVFADSDDQESLTAIAEIFDVPLTKEIEYTAWVRVDMTVEVELGGDTDAIEDFIAQNLTVDSYDSLIQVNNHEVDRVEEGAY